MDTSQRIHVEVAGQRLELAVRHDADAGDLHWNRLWPASVGLAEFLVSRGRDELEGRTVVELGCGTALVGIIAARLGAHVVCTDISPEALELARFNAELNGTRLADTEIVDWCDPPAPRACDILLGADVLYDVQLVEPLSTTILGYLGPQTRLLLSDAIRTPFNALLERFRALGLEHRQDLLDVRIGRREHRVGVYSVRRRRAR